MAESLLLKALALDKISGGNPVHQVMIRAWREMGSNIRLRYEDQFERFHARGIYQIMSVSGR